MINFNIYFYLTILCTQFDLSNRLTNIMLVKAKCPFFCFIMPISVKIFVLRIINSLIYFSYDRICDCVLRVGHGVCGWPSQPRYSVWGACLLWGSWWSKSLLRLAHCSDRGDMSGTVFTTSATYQTSSLQCLPQVE